MPDRLSFYLAKIQRLRLGRSCGAPAPHKLLLLLAILDLIEQGTISTNRIPPSPQLVETYIRYWKRTSIGQARPFMRFNYLRSSGFWHLQANEGQEVTLANAHAFSTMSHLASVVAYASFDDELFALLLDATTREVIRQTVIETHFPGQRSIVEGVTNENRAISNVEQSLLQQAKRPSIVVSVPVSPTRSAAFLV